MNKQQSALHLATMRRVMDKYERGDELTKEDRDAFDAADEAMRHDKIMADHFKREGLRGIAAPADETPEGKAFTNYLMRGAIAPELRDGQAEGTGSAGGFLVPQSFWASVQVALKQYGGMAQYFAQQDTPDGRIMPFPTDNPTEQVGSYIQENTQVDDQDEVFGQGMLYAFMVDSGVVKCSFAMAQDSAINVDAYVAQRLGERIGRKIAQAIVSGAGPASQEATGVLTALASYGSTTDNLSGGYLPLGSATAVKLFSGSTTELAANVLSPASCFSLIKSIDPAYLNADGGCAFYMNSDQAWNERQVVDDNGRPLLNLDDGYADGAIGTIGGFPVRVVQEIPDLSASTVGGPVFGNLSHGMVLRQVQGANVLRQEFNVMRLTERYADFLQIGYIGWARFDSQPIDMRAMATVQAASS